MGATFAQYNCCNASTEESFEVKNLYSSANNSRVQSSNGINNSSKPPSSIVKD